MSSSERDVRIGKLAQLRELGIQPYPERWERSHSVAAVRALAEGLTLEPGGSAEGGEQVRVAGRLMAYRSMGKLAFGQIQDVSGRLQIALNQRTLEKDACKRFDKLFDLGDHVGVQGRLFVTKRGELTVNVEAYHMLGKALRPLPEKWHGLQQQEACWRQRYLDLITNSETRKRFRQRAAVIRTMRAFLDAHDFEEVDTPVLTARASGAMARPFASHHNALDMEVFLRIAPETYLKRLVVGGFERVYEFARCFRNEGLDPSHLQDFTMLEWYVAYWNYEDNMAFTERLIKHTIEEVGGSLQVQFGGREVDFAGTWPRRSLRDLIFDDCGIDIDVHETAGSLRQAIRDAGVEIEHTPGEMDKLGRGNLVDRLYKVVSRPKIVEPLFVIAHPADLSPLARRNDRDPSRADRFQLVVCGWEIVNAYSELVDPLLQRECLEQQAQARQDGDDEAMAMEEDYLVAMEYGMPPISGFGLGIDRFVALLTGAENLRDVVLFPLMRPTS